MSDEELWRRVRSRLTARPEEPSQISADVESLPDRATTVRVARFVVDLFEGDAAQVDSYMRRYQQRSTDRSFVQAVRREVNRILAKDDPI